MLPRLVVSVSKQISEEYVKKVIHDEHIHQYNVFTLEPEDATLSIDQARSLSSAFLTKTPDLKLIVVHSFDSSTVEAQNSLLKLLEEKTEQALFLLFVANAQSVLSTIRSRTTVIQLKNAEKKGAADMDALIDAIQKKHSYAFLNEEAHLLKTKEDVIARLDNLVAYYKKVLLQNPQPANTAILKKILVTRQEVQTNNLNPQFAYDNLLIFISKLVSMK